MGLSTLLHFGISMYEAYDDGLFNGHLPMFGAGYPSMYGQGFPSMYGQGFPSMYGQGSPWMYGHSHSHPPFGFY